jgi:aminomethyltransferase
MAMSRRTPLHDVHVALGANLADFAGWSMPIRYGSDVAEHHAVRTAAGLFDLSHMGEIELTGPGAAAALDHALVGNPSKIAPGRARYSMLCDDNGGILDDLVVYRLAAERFLLVVNASNVAVAHEALTARSAAFETEVRDASEDWALIAVQGPAAVETVARLTELDVSALKYYSIAEADLQGASVLLARTGYTGEDGFEIYCRPQEAPDVWAEISAAGEEFGLVAAGLAARDTLRLEAGMPLYGHELSREVTPFEAGLGRLVALDKPSGFVGRSALAERHRQGPDVMLCGLVTAGPRSARQGYAVLDPATGEAVGRVTSGAPSPTLGRPIALAYVPTALSVPGTPLSVDIRGSVMDALVVDLPFYRRDQ